MADEVIALRRYGLTVLTPQRKQLLGKTLLDLESNKINVAKAKVRLQGNILFTREILNALEKAHTKR